MKKFILLHAYMYFRQTHISYSSNTLPVVDFNVPYVPKRLSWATCSSNILFETQSTKTSLYTERK